MAKLGFKDKQITGNVGLFYVAYKLSRMGWNVLPTSRNAKGIDLLIYGKHGEIFHTIQAKSYTRKEAVGPFKEIPDAIADFYVVVCNVYQYPKTYILANNEVKALLKPNKKGYWLQFKDYMKEDFLDKWNKIGYGFADDIETEQIINMDKELNGK
jgi:hypothetical protein